MSTARTFPRLLPHEWCFGGFMFLTWVRLIAKVGLLDPDALLYLVLILIATVLTLRCTGHETKARWYARLWFYPVSMNIVFLNLGTASLKLVPQRQDAILQRLDTTLAGLTPSLRCGGITTPWLTEILSFCYLMFFPWLLLSLAYYAGKGLPLFRRLVIGLFTVYAFGFLGYSLLPAAGPWVAMKDDFPSPLTGYTITSFNQWIVARGTNGVDVFPSLHCAITLFLLGFDRQHARWRFRLFLLPCCGLWVSTLYLRYHYLTDVLAGFALGAAALVIARRWTEDTAHPDSFSSIPTQPQSTP